MANLIGTSPDQVSLNGMLGDLAFQSRDSVSLTALSVKGSITTGSQFVSTLATGTAPFSVASTTVVANLSIGGTAAGLSSTLAIASGGTNSTALATAGGAGYGTGTAHAYTAAGTSGQVLTSAGVGTPTWATPTTGTVTSVGGTGTVSGLTLTGTVTTSGSLTLGGTLTLGSLNTLGNAGTATKLAAAVNINGVAFDGSGAITINAVDSTARVASSLLGAVSGVATLDASGKLTTSQIPSSLVGSIVYQGVWNASTNTPTIPAASSGNKGYYYKVSVAGTTAVDGYSNWSLGDLIISDGAAWDNVQGGSSDVVSVSGRVGAVVLTSTDVGLGNVSNTAQLAATQSLAITGDITASATGLSTGTIATTLATVNSNVGPFGSATNIPVITVDAKGRITAASNVAVSIPSGSISVTGGDLTLSGTTGTAITNATLATITQGTTGSFVKVTLDTKGRVTGNTAVIQSDITGLLGSGSITNAMLVNTAVANLSGTNTGDNAGVTSVSGTAPVVSSGGTTPAISMAAATTSANGYLTAADWTTFNGKQPAGAYLTTAVTSVGGTGTVSGLTLTGSVTTTGSLTLGGTLSLGSLNTLGTAAGLSTTLAVASGGTNSTATPTAGGIGYGTGTAHAYTAAGTSGQVLTSAGVGAPTWTTPTTGTVTSVSGTAPVVSSGGNTPAISMAAATTSVPGYLTAADWTTFNNKQVAGAYITTAVTSVAGTGTVSGLTLTGTVTTTGSLTLGGTLSLGSLNTLGTAAGLSSTLVIAQGGTNSTATPTAGGAVYGTGTAHAITAAGTAGQVLTSAGVGAPTWTTPTTGTTISGGTTGLTPASATSGTVTLGGTLVASNGGTGVATLTGLVYGNGTAAMSAATAAQVVGVIGATAVTNATNSTTCSGTAAGFPAAGVAEIGRYLDFHGASTGAADYDVRLDGGAGNGTAGSQALNVTAGGGLICNANITAYSDIRLKENISIIPNAMNKLMLLRGVTFTRNDLQDTTTLHTGVIAQEVLAVLPEAVTQNHDGIYSVAYGNMVGLLIEAIKEQQSIITNLSNRLDALESK